MLANRSRLAVLFISALLSSVVATGQSAKSQPIDVALDIDSFTHDADTYLLKARTNLPPKTRLWVRVTMDGYDGPNWDICVLAEVTDKGRIEAAISAPLGRPKTGPHTVDVLVPINSDSGFTEVFKAFQRASTMSSQSDAILAIVGEKGEQLQGPLVHRRAEGIPQMITAWSVWVETSAQFDVRDKRGKTDAEVAKREKGLYRKGQQAFESFFQSIATARGRGWLDGPTGFNTPAYQFQFERIRMLQQLATGVAQVQGQEATCIMIDLLAMSEEIWKPFGSDPEAPARNKQLEKQVEEKLEELKALRAKLR